MRRKTSTLIQKLAFFTRKPFPEKLNALQLVLCRLKGVVYYRRVFGSFGSGSALFKPTLLNNPQFMHIGKNVTIRPGARLEAIQLDPDNPPELRIGDNVMIEQDAHIICLGKVHIADNAGLAPRCALLCGTHPFLDVHDPVKIGSRLSGANSVIKIGEGSVLGIGTVVFMNVKIGKYVMTGANCVVKKSIPDYSVVDGNPASVVLKYNFETESWVTLKSQETAPSVSFRATTRRNVPQTPSP